MSPSGSISRSCREPDRHREQRTIVGHLNSSPCPRVCPCYHLARRKVCALHGCGEETPAPDRLFSRGACEGRRVISPHDACERAMQEMLGAGIRGSRDCASPVRYTSTRPRKSARCSICHAHFFKPRRSEYVHLLCISASSSAFASVHTSTAAPFVPLRLRAALLLRLASSSKPSEDHRPTRAFRAPPASATRHSFSPREL